MKRVKVETFDGYRVCVDLGGNIQEYAYNFLRIFNNVKQHKELISVSNNYGSFVYVVCTKESLGATKEFLSMFGEVSEDVDRVQCIKIDDDIDFDFNKYDMQIVDPSLD